MSSYGTPTPFRDMRPAFVVLLLAVVLIVPVGTVARAPAPPVHSALPLVTDAVAVPRGAPVSPLPATAPIAVTLTLAPRAAGGLAEFLSAVQNPKSPRYHHFLSESEFLSTYAPRPTTSGSVAEYLRSIGGTSVRVSPDRLSVRATLPTHAIEGAFGVHLVRYGSDHGSPIYTALGRPGVPSALSGVVDGIGGLSNAANPGLELGVHGTAPLRPLSRAGPQFVLSNTSQQWLVGSDFTQVFGSSRLLPGNTSVPGATFPNGTAIATLLASSYNETTNQNLPPWDPAVVLAYFNDTFPAAWPHPTVVGVPVTVGGITPPAPGSLGALNDTSLDEFENSLDLEMAGSMAPGAGVYNFYFGGSLLAANGPLSDVADAFALDLSTALSYSYGAQHLGVVTGSFGLPDLNDSAWNSALAEAAATGVTVAIASGDQGNAPANYTGRTGYNPWPVWPASAAFNTSGSVSVGGFSLQLNGRPTATFNGTSLNLSFDSNITGIANLAAWYDTLGGIGAYAGTEGGASTVFPEPAWQFHSAAQPTIVNATVIEGASALGRTGPDIAFPANSTVAYVYADAARNIYFTVLEGTSVAAPVFAGWLADEIAVTGSEFGYITPELYRIGSYFAAHPGLGNPYLDVLVGGNFVFTAGPGWDATTGWGGLDAVRFLGVWNNTSVTGYTYTGPTPGLPATPTPGIDYSALLLVGVLAVAAGVALVLAFGRPRARGPPPPPPGPFGGSPYYTYPQPPGGRGPTYPAPLPPSGQPPGPLPPPPYGGAPSGATFLCPYCGSPRPAEPVRCPRCGAM